MRTTPRLSLALALCFYIDILRPSGEWILNLFYKAGKANSNNDDFQFWQQDNHPIQLITPKFTHEKLDYLHNNPVVAGFVEKPEDYLYSSARDYYGIAKGLLDVLLIDPLIVTY